MLPSIYQTTLVNFCMKLQEIILTKQKQIDTGISEKELQQGYIDSLYRVLSLLKQQAEMYDLSLYDIGIDKINPKDVL